MAAIEVDTVSHPNFSSPAEIVKGDVALWYPQVVEHLEDRRIHHRRAAEVVLDVFRRRMILEIVCEDNLVDKSNITLPIVFRLWLGKSDIEFEVWKLLFNTLKMVDIEKFANAATTIPKPY